ncbi:MAG: diguanylate cyclase [Spirochaetales bacterium]|nr:diguanylate cyclase [Spirochaetales bacterium]
MVNSNRKITFRDEGAVRISGLTADEVMGLPCSANILNHGDDAGKKLCLGLCPSTHSIEDGKSRKTCLYLHHKQGHRVPVLVLTTVYTYQKTRKVYGIEMFSDLSQQAAAKTRIRELEKMALLDPLTQLANRHYISLKFDQNLFVFVRYKIPFGVLFLDIDHFKHINATYGHETGDKVITCISKTLRDNTRTFDIFGR